MSKIVCTIIIDIDEQGYPHRRNTGPVDSLPAPAFNTFMFIRQRYKFIQAELKRWHDNGTNPWMQAMFHVEKHEEVRH